MFRESIFCYIVHCLLIAFAGLSFYALGAARLPALLSLGLLACGLVALCAGHGVKTRARHRREAFLRKENACLQKELAIRKEELARMGNAFVSVAAHEFQTPLTAILGFSQLLCDAPEPRFTPQEREEFARHIRESAERLSRLVRDLLDLGYADSGGGRPLHLSRVRIPRLVGRLTAKYRSHFPGRPFALQFDDPRTDVLADPEKISLAMEHLLENALKFSGPKAQVRLSGATVGDCYRITISDEGIGMTPEESALSCSPFYRADISNKARGGIGLGMSVARTLVEAHGGTLAIQSEPGRGTTVRLTLPLPQNPPALSLPSPSRA